MNALHERTAAERDRLRKALERLGSTEAFTCAMDLKFSPGPVLAEEIRVRGRFARDAAKEPTDAR